METKIGKVNRETSFLTGSEEVEILSRITFSERRILNEEMLMVGLSRRRMFVKTKK